MKTCLTIVIGCSLLSVLGAVYGTDSAIDQDRSQDEVAVYIPPSREAPDGGYPGGATRLHNQPIYQADS